MNSQYDASLDFLKCSNCSASNVSSIKLLHSRLCLHKICETCFQRIFNSKNPTSSFQCKLCDKSRVHEAKDYCFKSREDMNYDNDIQARKKIMERLYKRLEDFNNEDEYDDYLEYLEDLVNDCKGKDLDAVLENFPSVQISTEKVNANLVKREQEINRLNELGKKRDPNFIYNSKIDNEEEMSSMMQIDIGDTIEKGKKGLAMQQPKTMVNYQLPQYREEARITIVRDRNLMISAGGYNLKQAYEDLSRFARMGF